MKTTETKLMRIAKLSEENPEMEYRCLMPHFNKETLTECFHKLDGKKAVGADEITKEEYGKHLEENIAKLIEKMKKMAYKPGAVREVLIPKEGQKGKYRPLGISNIEDKIVQEMMKRILEAIYEPIFCNNSYGFRPGKSCHTALRAVSRHLNSRKVEVVIDVDLENFFGRIEHKKLVEFLREKIKDERFIRYVVRMLKAGVLREGGLYKTEEGSPQGNIVSPVLSNIYAHYVIDKWFEGINKETEGRVENFRYADDCVACCENEAEGVRIKEELGNRLEEYGLRLNKDKTRIVRLDRREYEKGNRQETFDYLGLTYYIGWARKKGRTGIKVKTSRKRIRTKLAKVKEWIRTNRHKMKLRELWDQFRIKMKGHIRYYGVTHNWKSLVSFLWRATKIFYKWINRRSQRKSIAWEKFKMFMKQNPMPEVKVYHPMF